MLPFKAQAFCRLPFSLRDRMDGVQIGTASRVATGASSRCYSVGCKWELST